jgi:misacylated tRNA(Ala) deacylase
MTHPTYYDDAYLTSLEATVTRVTAENIELDSTIFYPTGGGQPGDTGVLTTPTGNEIAIVNTIKDRETGSIVHVLEQADNGLNPGDTVNISIDWQRRYCHMRMHTAMHLLGSLIPVPVTGGQVGAEKSRLDFDVGEHQLDKEQLTQDINSLVEAGHDLAISSITDAELDENPGLVRTMSVQPPRGAGTIRMIRVQDVDYQPCGGTHVRNTAEIGPVVVSKIENKGKRNRRVHLKFDPA